VVYRLLHDLYCACNLRYFYSLTYGVFYMAFLVTTGNSRSFAVLQRFNSVLIRESFAGASEELDL